MSARSIRSLPSLAGLAALALAGCTGDQITPNCFQRDAMGRCKIPGPVAGAPSVSCGPLAPTALRASVDYQPPLAGGQGPFAWSATGLPPGLAIDPATGRITGTPTQTGSFEVAVFVRDTSSDLEDSAACGEWVVNEALAMDPSAGLAFDRCIPADMDLRGFLSGGTGDDITCTLPSAATPSAACPIGRGNGRLPQGLTWDAAQCRATGTISETRWGTWVWMVRLEQSGAQVWVPICASRTPPAGADHEIEVFPAGSADGDPLAPVGITFRPEQPLTMAADIPDSVQPPTYEVRGTDCSGNACNAFSFSFGVDCSAFASGFNPLSEMPLFDGNGNRVGLTHRVRGATIEIDEMTGATETKTVAERGFADRPWVVSWQWEYCTANAANVCDNPGQGARSSFIHAIIATPQSP